MDKINITKKVIFPSNNISEIIANLVEKGLKFYPNKKGEYILGIGKKTERLQYGINALHGLLQILEIEKEKMFGISYFFWGKKKLDNIKIVAKALMKEHKLPRRDMEKLFRLYNFEF